MTPTRSQTRAIEASTQGDVCVVAGPGSGKTTVLVERFLWLVSAKDIPPDEIAAITFTEKAAANMLERLVAHSEPENRQAFQLARISTIHGFCGRLLREHSLQAGLDPTFEVIDAWEAEIQLRRSIAAVLDRRCLTDPKSALTFLKNFYGSGDHVNETELSSVHKEIGGLYNTIREWGARPESGSDSAGFSPLQEEGRAWLVETLKQVDEDYRATKRRYGWLDFSDLQQETIDLIESSPEVRFPFRAILVDEFQDTNHLQKRLIERIKERAGSGSCRMFAVGDVNQAVYGFRHADPEIFRDLRSKVRKEQGTVVQLGDNFRSRTEILQAVELIFERSDSGVERRELSAARELPAKESPCVDVLVARSGSGGYARELEARLIADRILELRRTLSIGKPKQSPRWRDFAILARTRPVIADILPALRTAGIPYQLAAGSGFFDAPEIRDLLNFLRSARNPRNEIALAAYLCSPLAGVSADALFELKRRSGYRNLADALVAVDMDGLPDSSRLACARERLTTFREQRDHVSSHVLVSRLLSESGFMAYLEQSADGDLKSANVRKLLGVIRRLSERRRLGFDELVARLDEIQQSALDEPEAALAQEDLDAVKVMTMHAAKGLEFPVVILPSLQRQGSRRKTSSLYHPEHGVGARWDLPGTDQAEEDPAYGKIKQKYDQREKDEADRLLYVAMTRAEEHLVLSASFRGKVAARGWSKHLRNQLGVDFKEVTNAPKTYSRKGLQIRCLVTDQYPSFAVSEPDGRSPAASRPVISVDRAEPGDQADSAAAATSIALFADCPRRYYLSRYLGFPDGQQSADAFAVEDHALETTTEITATDLGQRVHEILAGKPPKEYENQEVLDLVRRFEQSDLGRRSREASQSIREKSLLFAVDGRLIRGQIDLWFDDGREQVLVDYKTDRLERAEVEHTAKTYAIQLQLYSLGIEKWRGRKPDRAVLHFLRPDVTFDIDLEAQAMDRAFQITEEFFEAQSNVAFPLKVGTHCFRCPYFKGVCPADLPAPDSPSDAASTQTSL